MQARQQRNKELIRDVAIATGAIGTTGLYYNAYNQDNPIKIRNPFYIENKTNAKK